MSADYLQFFFKSTPGRFNSFRVNLGGGHCSAFSYLTTSPSFCFTQLCYIRRYFKLQQFVPMSGGGGGGVGLKVVTLDAVYTDTLVLDDRRTVTPRAVKDADVIKFTERVHEIARCSTLDSFWEEWKVSRVICHQFITDINYGTFRDCLTLTHLVVEGECKIDYSAFKRCENLEEASLARVTEVCNAAFMGCKQLKKVSIDPTSSLEVWQEAFSDCTSLTTAPVLNYVAASGFNNCSSLTTVTVKQTNKQRLRKESAVIQGGAFKNCTSLRVVILDISEHDVSERPITMIHHHAFYGCNDRMEIKFVDKKEIEGNRNPCLRICPYNSDERSWSSMYSALGYTNSLRDYSSIARFRRTISFVIDMGGGNSCTVTSTLLPGELPSAEECELARWNRSKLSIKSPAPPLLFSRLGGDDYEIYGWEIPGASYKDLLRTEYPEHFPDDNFHVAYVGGKVEPALDPQELAMGIVSGADWMSEWQKNEADDCESNYDTPWIIVYHDPDDAPHTPVHSLAQQIALAEQDLMRQQVELELRYPPDQYDSDEPDSDTETELRSAIRRRRFHIHELKKDEQDEQDEQDERRTRRRTEMPFTDLCAGGSPPP